MFNAENSLLQNSTADPLKSILFTLYFKKNTLPDNIKIVHLVRDPKDFITSFMRWKNRKLSGVVAHHFFPLWQPSPYFQKEVSLVEWIKMSKFEHFAWVWKFKNQLFHNTFSKYSNYKLFRIEDLTKKENNKWKELIEFIGMKNIMDDKNISFCKVNESTKKKFPKWQQWNNKKHDILNRHCRELINKYGY